MLYDLEKPFEDDGSYKFYKMAIGQEGLFYQSYVNIHGIRNLIRTVTDSGDSTDNVLGQFATLYYFSRISKVSNNDIYKNADASKNDPVTEYVLYLQYKLSRKLKVPDNELSISKAIQSLVDYEKN